MLNCAKMKSTEISFTSLESRAFVDSQTIEKIANKIKLKSMNREWELRSKSLYALDKICKLAQKEILLREFFMKWSMNKFYIFYSLYFRVPFWQTWQKIVEKLYLLNAIEEIEILVKWIGLVVVRVYKHFVIFKSLS